VSRLSVSQPREMPTQRNGDHAKTIAKVEIFYKIKRPNKSKR